MSLKEFEFIDDAISLLKEQTPALEVIEDEGHSQLRMAS